MKVKMKNMSVDIEIENRVWHFRKKLGLSQQKLGEKAGISRQSILAIEKKRFMPSIKTAILLAEALHCTLDELFWIKRSGKDSGGERTMPVLPEIHE
jgi:putative transcriptional regulator